MRQFCDTFIETVYKIQVFTSLTVYDLLEKHLMTQEALFLPLDNFHHHQTQRCCVWSKLISRTNIKCQTNCLNVCFKEYILVKQNNDKGIRWADHVSLKEFDIDQTKHCNTRTARICRNGPPIFEFSLCKHGWIRYKIYHPHKCSAANFWRIKMPK